MRTQVGIVGAGPAGLMLAHLLHLEGIESVVIESRSRQYCEERVRAGVLEQGTVDLMVETGVGDRLRREGLVHRGIEISFLGTRHRIDLEGLTGGKCITVYAQHEVIKDLIGARLAHGGPIVFDARDVSVQAIDSNSPLVHFRDTGGQERDLQCDFIAGCDGFHGITRGSIPPGVLSMHNRDYPFAWLGILAEAAPAADKVIYTYHQRGFALFSMRSLSVTRLYLQCGVGEDLAQWPDDRIWEELETRLRTHDGWVPARGTVLQRGVAEMRGFVAEPMQYGRLYLAGDAAHIVPPTGAKGLNLALADVRVLARGLAEFFRSGRRALLDRYSEICLRRVWKVQRFSWWMTSMLHRFPDDTGFDHRRQLAELDYLVTSRAAMTSLAENYVGLPFD
jgi:p-hydroxybenzoate 3-monooxygenase